MLFSALVLGACGGGQTTSSPKSPNETEPSPAAPVLPATEEAESLSELDALIHDLEVSAHRIDAELVRKREEALAVSDDRSAPKAEAPEEGSGAGAPSKSRAAASKPPARAAAPSGPAAADPTAAPTAAPTPTTPAEPQATVGSPCDLMCRALASMERSAARICELTSDSDQRCLDARAMVQKSRARVASGNCWCQSWGPPPPSR